MITLEIDQSGKFEATSQQTVIGCANGATSSVIISSKDKRAIQKHFRNKGQPRLFVLKTFAALIACALAPIDHLGQIVIDTEYPGHEQFIRLELIDLMRKLRRRIRVDQISFTQVGKKSPAHRVAYEAYTTQKADKKLSAQAIRALLL